jgi:hypothetical protein
MIERKGTEMLLPSDRSVQETGGRTEGERDKRRRNGGYIVDRVVGVSLSIGDMKVVVVGGYGQEARCAVTDI